MYQIVSLFNRLFAGISKGKEVVYGTANKVEPKGVEYKINPQGTEICSLHSLI